MTRMTIEELRQQANAEFGGPDICAWPTRPGQKLRPGKGGGGSVKYDNLEVLYGLQAQQAQQMLDQANNVVTPAYNEMMESARGAGSIANQEEAAARAGADVAAAQGGAKAQLEQDLSSMGVNPADQKYANTMASMDLAAAAESASAQTGARERTRQYGDARMKDVTAMGMGISSDAATALGNAANTAGGIANMQQQQAAMNAQSRGNIAALGTRLLGFKTGGLVPRFARGGFMAPIQAPAAPAAGGAAPAPSPVSTAGSALAAPGKIGTAIEGVGNAVGSNAMSSFGAGLRLGDAAKPAVEAFKAASTVGETAAGAAGAAEAAGGAAAAGEAAAGAAAAGEAAAGATAAAEAAGTAATAMEAGSTIAGALGTAMPWIGGAMLVGSALDLFADGGEVGEGDDDARDGRFVDGSRGGLTRGPGGPKDDLIPTELPEGGFVMPAGAVHLLGHEKLEDMRREGEAEDRSAGKQVRTAKAMTSPGEFILPPGAVRLYGRGQLEKMRARGLRYEKQIGVK